MGAVGTFLPWVNIPILGAVYGTLLVNFGKTYFSEHFPELWLFLMAGLFLSVVMLFPNGLAGIVTDYGPALRKLFFRRQAAAPVPAKAEPVLDPAPCITHAPITAARPDRGNATGGPDGAIPATR